MNFSNLPKIKIYACSENDSRLRLLFKNLSSGRVVEDLDQAEIVIVDIEYSGPTEISADTIFPGLHYLYSLRTSSAVNLPVLLLTNGEKAEILTTEIIPARVFQISTIESKENWQELISSLPDEFNLDLKKFDDFAKYLRDIHFKQDAKSTQAKITRPKLSSDFKWNVLVIDNEILEGGDSFMYLRRVLGFPGLEFFEKINPIPYYPKHLVSDELNVKEFLIDLRHEIYIHDIDLILLDTFLDFPGINRDKNAGERRYGFNFIDLIEKQCLILGRQPIPIIAMTSYDEDFAAIVESVRRGARWFCSKKDVNSESWVGNLPKILEEIYSLEPNKTEYLEKILSACGGDTQIKLKKCLTLPAPLSSDKIPVTGFDLRDSFFMDEGDGKSLDIIASACRHERELKYDLNKFWEYHYIFHKLFARYDQIKILQKSNKGFSGTDVFYVIPYADGVEYSVHIVKIGARDLIEREANNFQEWINGMLDSFIGRIKGKPVVGDAYAGLLYITVGIKEDYLEGQKPISLRDVIVSSLEGRAFRNQKIEWEEVINFVRYLFSNVLSGFYRHTNPGKNTEIAKLISIYLDELPSIVSGEFCQTCETDETLELKNLEELLDLIKKDKIERGQNILLKNFEINEIDRIGKKLKLTNKHYFLPPEQKPYAWKISEEERHLAELKNKVDLRIDVHIGDNPQGNEWIEDPRVSLGKRLQVGIRYAFFAWDDPKVQFMNNGAMTSAFHIACKHFLNHKLISTLSGFESDQTTTVLKSEDDEIEEYWLFKQVNEIFRSGLLTIPRKLTFSHIHGDLNLENILITRSGDKLLGWIIDFAKSRKGHAPFDFVKVETELKTQIIAPYLENLIGLLHLVGLNLNQAVKICLDWFTEFEKTGTYRFDLEIDKQTIAPAVYREHIEKICKVFDLIVEIRRLASRYKFGTEYNWGLLFYSLTVLKFKNLDETPSSPLPKTLAYLSGSVAYMKLAQSDSYFEKNGDFQQIHNLMKQENLEKKDLESYLKISFKTKENANWAIEFLEKVRNINLPRSVKDENWNKIVEQTKHLTEVISEIGTRGDLMPDWDSGNFVSVDCPSTGGSGNKLPIILPPLVIEAASILGLGSVVIPKVSTRGIPSGTIDILESISYRAEISLDQYVQIIKDKQVGYSNIAPTNELAPIDALLMKQRKEIGAMRHPMLVVASIIGKKLATNCKKLVIEIKTGKETKMRFPGLSVKQAAELGAQLFIAVGRKLGINVVCLLSDGNRPQGKFVGNYLALFEVVALLKNLNEKMPVDWAFREQVICFATEMLKLCFPNENWKKLEDTIVEILENGTAYNRFTEQLRRHLVSNSAIEQLEADVAAVAKNGFTSATEANDLYSVKAELGENMSGIVTSVDVELIDENAKLLIAKDKKIFDYESGIILHKQVGEKVNHNDLLAILKGNDRRYLEKAANGVKRAFSIYSESEYDETVSYLQSKVCFNGKRVVFYDWQDSDWVERS